MIEQLEALGDKIEKLVLEDEAQQASAKAGGSTPAGPALLPPEGASDRDTTRGDMSKPMSGHGERTDG